MPSTVVHTMRAALVIVAILGPATGRTQVVNYVFGDGFDCGRWFADADMDGFGNGADFVESCVAVAGRVSNPLDCNDGDPNIKPSATDLPDGAYADVNCDGMDGDVAKSFFVATSGSNANPGTRALPFASVATGVAAAAGDPTRKNVLVAAGTYIESIALPDGVSLYGQYAAADWSRAGANTTAIAPSAPGAVALTVDGYTQNGAVEGFSLSAGPTPMLVSGASSVAAVVRNAQSGFALRYDAFLANAGTNGGAGADGPALPAGTDGGMGGNGASNSSSGGTPGIGGTSACARPGGNGGMGGYNNGSGSNGVTPSMGGMGGSGSPATACFGTPVAGSPGLQGASGTNGSLGAAGGLGTISGLAWLPGAGGNGQAGTAGAGGGGGGGGGGGSDNGGVCNADRGGGGGGGGSGGCGGNFGAGGGGGGGSIGLLVSGTSAPVVTNNAFVTAKGGDGGPGGDGGAPGAPGGAGPRGNGADDSAPGGAGGAGRPGGNGGCGAGGAGGVSVGVLYPIGSGITLASNIFMLGNGGGAGAGGTTPSMALCASGPSGVSAQTLAQ